MNRIIIATSLAFLIAGCSTAPPPPSLAQADQAVVAAQEANASAVAPLEMQAAAARLSDARQAVDNNRTTEADRLAKEAIANAELAQAKNEYSQAQAALNDVQRAGH